MCYIFNRQLHCFDCAIRPAPIVVPLQQNQVFFSTTSHNKKFSKDIVLKSDVFSK